MADPLDAPRWVAPARAAGWREQAHDWLDESLAVAGLARRGAIATVKRAPWSQVVRIPTTAGPVWFKANVPTLGQEAALLARLAQLAPGSVPTPLAVEPELGWLLLPDRGPTLRTLGRDGDPDTWMELAGQWSAVVRGLAPHSAELEGLGVPRFDPADAGGYLVDRIAELAGLPATDAAHLTTADADRLRTVVDTVSRAGEQLTGLHLPLTLWHNDLHTNNVFAPDAAGRLTYFDLGDALIGTPLAELLIPLRFLTHARGGELSVHTDPLADTDLARIVEAVIEPWTDLAAARDLRAAVRPALLIGVLGRSESWRRAVASADAEGRAEFGDASTAWLLELVPD